MDLDRLKHDVENSSSLVRTTKTMAKLIGQYNDGDEDVQFTKKKHGIELKWAGYIDVPTAKKERCSLGHTHTVIDKTPFIYDYAFLKKEDVLKLAAWLTEQAEYLP